MRHKNIGRRFGKSSSYRKAMFYNLSRELIKHETITTTLPKAKELRRFVEPLITSAKIDSVTSRRMIFKKIKDKKVLGKLFSVLGKRYFDRPGGYLRIFKYKCRKGDGSTLALVKLV